MPPHHVEQTGLPGCGPATAFGLMRCGLGFSLLTVESSEGFSGSRCQAWRNDMAWHLRYDPTSSIGRHHPMLAEHLPDKIPNFDTWSAYLHPAVHEPLVPVREPGVPDVGKIADAVVSLLGWADAGRLLDTFRRKMWPGVVMSELLQDLSTWKPSNQDVSCCQLKVELLMTAYNKVALAGAATRQFFLHSVCKRQSVGGIPGYSVCMPANVLVSDTFRCLEHLSVPEGPSKPFCLWVPGNIYKAWTKFMWTSPTTGGEPSKMPKHRVVVPSSQDVIDLTNQSDDDLNEGSDEWMIDLTRGDPGCSSKSKGKLKAQPMDVIDLT